MQELVNFLVDLETQHPNPTDPTKVRLGDPARTAFTKLNDLISSLVQGVEYVGPTAPLTTEPYMKWLDTSAEPPVLKRRSADNTMWFTDKVVDGGSAPDPFKGEFLLRGRLPKGTNLNTFTSRDNIGIWSVMSSADATVALGFPADNLGACEVIILPAATGIIQIVRQYNSGRESFRGTNDHGNLGTWRTALENSQVVVNPLDNTPNRIPTVGWGGIGIGLAIASELRFTSVPYGFSVHVKGDHPDAPVNSDGVLHVMGILGRRLFRYVTYAPQREYVKSSDPSSVWREGVWKQELGSGAYGNVTDNTTDTSQGRILRVGDHGVGVQLVNIGYPDPRESQGFQVIPTGANTPGIIHSGGESPLWGVMAMFGSFKNGHAFGLHKDNAGDLGYIYKGSGTPSGNYTIESLFSTKNCQIIENANGTAFRFPNGIQICYRNYQFGNNRSWYSLGTTGLFTNEVGSVPYAASFTSTPIVSITPALSWDGIWVGSHGDRTRPLTGSPKFRFVAAGNSNLIGVGADIIAVGRYK